MYETFILTTNNYIVINCLGLKQVEWNAEHLLNEADAKKAKNSQRKWITESLRRRNTQRNEKKRIKFKWLRRCRWLLQFASDVLHFKINFFQFLFRYCFVSSLFACFSCFCSREKMTCYMLFFIHWKSLAAMIWLMSHPFAGCSLLNFLRRLDYFSLLRPIKFRKNANEYSSAKSGRKTTNQHLRSICVQSFECEFIKTIIKTFETMKMKISEWNSTWTFLHSILERWPPSIIILWVSTLGQNPPMSSPVICKLYPLILRQKRSYVLWHRWKTYLNAKHAAIKFITFHSGWVGGFFLGTFDLWLRSMR